MIFCNCNYGEDDLILATIFGPDVHTAHGKTLLKAVDNLVTLDDQKSAGPISNIKED